MIRVTRFKPERARPRAPGALPGRRTGGQIPARSPSLLATAPPLDPLAARLAAGLVAAALVAALAHRARALTAGGAVAATAVGAAAVAAGWAWGALLVLYFVLATGLSRVGAAVKDARTGSIVAKGGRRDAVQVAANGGVFALAALGGAVYPHPAWAAAAAGALAAAAADTWATEVGTLVGGAPRSIVTGRRVPVGTSGGVTVAGTAASAAGAAAIAAVAWLLGLPAAPLAVVAAGVAGAVADSLLGALVQGRRRCPRCGTATERIVHSCGERTVEAGGLTWMDNDVVNLLATAAGGGVAAALAPW